MSEKYDVNDLIFPLVVIDITEKVKENIRYAVTVEDIKAYEEKYGPIPDGAFVALRDYVPVPWLLFGYEEKTKKAYERSKRLKS